jgi:hypothetical protein
MLEKKKRGECNSPVTRFYPATFLWFSALWQQPWPIYSPNRRRRSKRILKQGPDRSEIRIIFMVECEWMIRGRNRNGCLLSLKDMLTMVGQIINVWPLCLLWQQQSCLQDSTKIIRRSLIFDKTLLKDTRPVNTISTIDGQIALIKCCIMRGTSS